MKTTPRSQRRARSSRDEAIPRPPRAIHEAGHAVAAVALRLGLISTEVHALRNVSRGLAGGDTVWTLLPDRRASDDLRSDPRAEAELIAMLAGGEAVRRSDRLGPTGDGFDVQEAERLAWRLTYTDAEARALLALQRIRARQLVAAGWPEIVAVRDALLARSKLSAREVRSIIARVEHASRARRRAQARKEKP